MSERRYNENELAEILRAAAEAQSKAPGTSEESSGYSLAEIERLAAEVGIDPAHVGQAAQGLTQRPLKSKGMRLFGGPDRHVIERTIEGTLDDIGWEDAVSELRSIFEGTGTTSEVGTGREWSGGTDFRAVHVSATTRNGKTKLVVTVNRRDSMASAWIVLILFLIFTTIATGVNIGVRHVGIPIALTIAFGIIFAIAMILQRVLSNIHSKDLILVEKFLRRTQELTTVNDQTEIAPIIPSELRTNA